MKPAAIYELCGSFIYNLPTAPLSEYVKNLGECLKAYAVYTDAPLTFMLDYGIPWLSQEQYFRTRSAGDVSLRSVGVDDKYIGAIRVDGVDIPKVVDAVFWLGRCNADLPYCWFVPAEEGIVGSVCKHGNLHFDAYSPMKRKR